MRQFVVRRTQGVTRPSRTLGFRLPESLPTPLRWEVDAPESSLLSFSLIPSTEQQLEKSFMRHSCPRLCYCPYPLHF